MTNKTGSPAYLEALKQLTFIINTEYAEGGKLPGAVEMCKRLNVCMVTYIKILKILCREGILVASKGRGGTHVKPRKDRLRKIGVVIRNAEDSPFLGDSISFLESIRILNQEHFCIHIIQAAKMDQVYDKAIFHGVCGLIWFLPDLKAIPYIEKIQKETDMPILVLDPSSYEVREVLRKHRINGVFSSLVAEAETLADYAAAGNHHSILYVNRFSEANAAPLIHSMQKRNILFDPSHYILLDRLTTDFLPKLRETKATLVLAEGGFPVYSKIFDFLSLLPKNARPEVLVRNCGNMPDHILSVYPDIRIGGRMCHDLSELAQRGAWMMIERILNKKPLSMQEPDVFSICPCNS